MCTLYFYDRIIFGGFKLSFKADNVFVLFCSLMFIVFTRHYSVCVFLSFFSLFAATFSRLLFSCLFPIRCHGVFYTYYIARRSRAIFFGGHLLKCA